MASDTILQRLQAEFDNPPAHIEAVVTQLEAGAPALFIDRFRRDATGDLGEERILAIEERMHFLKDLESRKEAIRQTAQQRAALSDELQRTLDDCYDQDQLDDIYQTFRPKRRTAAAQAEEKGLLPLALAIRHWTVAEATLQEAAQSYVSAEKDLPDTDSVIEGAGLILAEQFAGDATLRATVREELSRGILKATATAPTRKDAQRYREFFDFAEPVRKIAAQRMLALRRAEREGILALELTLPEGRELEIFRERFAPDRSREGEMAAFLDEVFKISYSELVRPACEMDIRKKIKEKADRETVRAFARSLRSQLLAPPLGPKKAMALRATRQTAWFVVLGEDGSVLTHRAITLKRDPRVPEEAPPETTPSETNETPTASDTPPAADPAPAEPARAEPSAPVEAAPAAATPPPAVDAPAAMDGVTRAEAIKLIVEAIELHRPAAVAVPHGRRHELSDAVAQEAVDAVSGAKPFVVPVDEAPSTIYATSTDGRKEFHGAEVGVRTAISLARRMQDPMLELMCMDLRALGLGQSLGEVHQGMLQRHLDQTLASCIARLGLDVNRADHDQLSRVPGLGAQLAKAIVEHRRKHGGFQRIEDLQQVQGVSAETLAHFAGFMRLPGGAEPLDATGIHLENYELVRRIASDQGTTVEALLGKSQRNVDLQKYLSDTVGRLRLLNVLHALEDHGSDPRGPLTSARNESIKSIADLRPEMELKGRVASLTDFGAFVDLGIGHDGLIHISQIPAARLRDPDQMLRVGEVVTVYVNHVEQENQRISLSMYRPRPKPEQRDQRPQTLGERMQQAIGKAQRRSGTGRSAPAPQMQSRAARAPEGRRGGQHGVRRPKDREERGSDHEHEHGGGHGFGRGRRDPDASAGEPRVFTVESGKQAPESLGPKGEFRSLSGLRALLRGPAGKSDGNAAPDDPPKDEGTPV